MKKAILYSLLLLALAGLFASFGSKKSAQEDISIDGTYYYQDHICRSTVTIYGDTWQMKTQFGAPSYYGLFKYGEVSGRTLTIAGRRYSKQ